MWTREVKYDTLAQVRSVNEKEFKRRMRRRKIVSHYLKTVSEKDD